MSEADAQRAAVAVQDPGLLALVEPAIRDALRVWRDALRVREVVGVRR